MTRLAMPPFLSDVPRIDRGQISYVTALRNAVGVVAPLLVGALTGQLLAGLTVGLAVGLGALQAAFSDGTGPYTTRARQMLLAGLCGALSVFVGSTTGASAALATPVAALWGLGAGLLVALGPAATQIGLTSVVLLLVFGAQPAAPGHAVGHAALVGGRRAAPDGPGRGGLVRAAVRPTARGPGRGVPSTRRRRPRTNRPG